MPPTPVPADARRGRSKDAADPGSAAATLERAGERWTPLRAAVLRVLGTTSRPMSAYAVATALGREQGRDVAPNTVDQILRLFARLSLVRRIECARGYLIAPDPVLARSGACLVCECCGCAVLVSAELAGRRLRRLANNAGYAPDRLIVELIGRCARCSRVRDA